MKRKTGCWRWWLLGLVLLLSVVACKEDEYHYPDVRLEYLTAHSGADGYLETVLADDGTSYDVLNTVAAPHLVADSTLRIVANYETSETDGTAGAWLYAAQAAISPFPLPVSAFKDGVKSDPASVLSIWMGLDYLNIVLEVKAADGIHTFHFVEERVEREAERCNVSLSLYHNAGHDPAYYTRRVYLSVPLRQYAADGIETVSLRFSLRNYAGETEAYTFDYVPSSER